MPPWNISRVYTRKCNIIPWLYIFCKKAYQSTFITRDGVEKVTTLGSIFLVSRRVSFHVTLSFQFTKLHWNDSVTWNDTLYDSRKMDPNWPFLVACRAAAKPSVRLTPATIMYADNNSSNLGIMRSAQYLHQVWSLTFMFLDFYTGEVGLQDFGWNLLFS